VAAEHEALIEAVEGEWRDALCAKDMVRLKDLVHPEFVLIGTRSTGPFVMRRDDWLDAIQRRDVSSIKLRIQDALVTDNIMIGTIQARWSVRHAGKQFDDCVLLTDVWIREDDRWRVIRRHSTPLPPGECVN
jgi:ketosteroid isomerase-like protein